MQPEESLAAIERTIRKAIRLMLPKWEELLNASDAGRAATALAREERTRRGVQVSGDLLDYLYTKPAFEIVREHWAAFEPMLGDRARMEALLLFVEDVRNTVAHGRQLVSFERDMVSGVAGYLANLVAIWETRSDDIAAHYPVITNVRDSFGREGSANQYGGLDYVRVDVGDYIEFSAQATEARGQGVLWLAMFSQTRSGIEMQASTWKVWPEHQRPIRARGANVRFRLRVTDDQVGEEQKLWVAITSKSRHHRLGSIDDFRRFGFSVNPPRDR